MALNFGAQTPAPAATFNFSGGAPPPAAPTPSTGFGTTPVSGGGVSNNNALASLNAPQQPLLVVPEYDSLFYGQTLYAKVESLATRSREEKLAGEELLYTITKTKDGDRLVSPPVFTQHQPNLQLRQQFASSSSQPLVTFQGQPATLTHATVQQLFALADNLFIQEETAFCLYGHANSAHVRAALAAAYERDELECNVVEAARALYTRETGRAYQALALLMQLRLDTNHACAAEIAQATDFLLDRNLVLNLIHCVRSYTQIMSSVQDQVVQENVARTAYWKSCNAHRQAAMEILFVIAYNTQFKGSEVAALIQLIRDLSNGLDRLDPFENVPFPYANVTRLQLDHILDRPADLHAAHASFLETKDAFQWQQELVVTTRASGQPHLLRCVGVGVLAVLCALESQVELLDRRTHAVNDFGRGNAFLPPGSTTTSGLEPFHSLLTQGAKDWKRTDVLGILMASYSLLLSSVPSALTPNVAGRIDVHQALTECLNAPTKYRSITFGRLSLLPALRLPFKSIANFHTSDFLLSVLANFTSRYLDLVSSNATLTISRAKWQQDAGEELQYRATQQIQAIDFQPWSGGQTPATIPSAVNLLERPDCMDDVVAFAVAVCSLGPSYSVLFWSTEDVDNSDTNGSEFFVKLVPSPALQKLESQQLVDDSLKPCYLSFLGALALANADGILENGSTVLHHMLSNPSHPKAETWTSMLGTMRHYVKELDPLSEKTVSTKSAASSSYYYDKVNVDDTFLQQKKTSDTLDTFRELGEENEYIVTSLLTLMSNVAKSSPSSRLAIIDTSLPIKGPRRNEIIGHDNPLMILLTFASQAVSPEIRGATFTTIASLLSLDGASSEERERLNKVAVQVWDVLDSCQILPIYLLEQYPSETPVAATREIDSQLGLSFPPASTSLVVDTGKSWISADPRYSILYEMEFVESAVGVYPSTEGFLQLLRSLFDAAGSPQDLGQKLRARCGCTPYIEYVMHLVLPRSIGKFSKLPPLPFRSMQDRDRLVSLALDVIVSVATRHVVPSVSLESQQYVNANDVSRDRAKLLQSAEEKVGLPIFCESLVVMPHVNDAVLFSADVHSGSSTDAELFQSSQSKDSLNKMAIVAKGNLPAPRSKSPAFTVLVDILSSSGGLLLDSLLDLLADAADTKCMFVDYMSLSMALFNDTPPTFTSVVTSLKRSSVSPSRAKLLLPLRAVHEELSFDSAMHWKERSIRLTLRVLCAAIVRENALNNAIGAIPGKKLLIPTLRFEKRAHAISAVKSVDLHLSRLSQLLLCANSRTGFLCNVAKLVECHAKSDENDIEMATGACALLMYIGKQSSPGDLYRTNHDVQLRIAKAFSERLLVSSNRTTSKQDTQLMRIILDHILFAVRSPENSGPFLFSAFSFPADSSTTDNFIQNDETPDISNDCFWAILQILNNASFVMSPQTSDLAASCYEVLFRLYDLDRKVAFNVQIMKSASLRLRAVDFWRRQLKQLIGLQSSYVQFLIADANIIHSISWVLRSLAIELQFLRGTIFGPPELSQLRRLFSFLFSAPFDAVRVLLHSVSFEKVTFNSLDRAPSPEVVKKAKKEIHGSLDVTQGYSLVDADRLISDIDDPNSSTEVELRAWCAKWNLDVQNECAVAHLTKAIHLVLGSTSVDDMVWMVPGFNGFNIASAILGQMIDGVVQHPANSMDDVYFTTATHNLALAGLESSKFVAREVSNDVGTSSQSADVTAILSAFAKAIEFSGTPPDATGQQRTAILASGLALILNRMQDVEIEVDSKEFVKAGIVLARLACAVPSAPSNIIPCAPSTIARIARSCLSLLFEFSQDQNQESKRPPYIETVLMENDGQYPQNVICSLVSLLPRLDWDVSELLQKIALVRTGGEMLVNAGVFPALKSAADGYMKEELMVTGSSGNSPYQRFSVEVPIHFKGHVQLMYALMSTDVSVYDLRAIAQQSISTLNLYGAVLERLLKRFSSTGDTLQTVFRCLALAKCILHRNSPLEVMDKSPVFLIDSFERSAAYFVIDIAENPLPRQFIPPLPSWFDKKETGTQSNAVSMSVPVDTSWWEALEVKLDTPNSLEAVFDYALVGADMVRCGLYMLETLPDFCDGHTLARCLCRCVDSIRTIDGHLESQRITSLNGLFLTQDLSTDRHEAAEALKSILIDSVNEFLALGLRLATRFSKGDYSPHHRLDVADFQNIMLLALDYCRLDTREMKSIEPSNGDENHPGFLFVLAKALCSELAKCPSGL